MDGGHPELSVVLASAEMEMFSQELLSLDFA